MTPLLALGADQEITTLVPELAVVTEVVVEGYCAAIIVTVDE